MAKVRRAIVLVCGGFGVVGLVLIFLVIGHVLAWEAVRPFAVVLGIVYIACIFINPVMSRREYNRTGGRWNDDEDQQS